MIISNCCRCIFSPFRALTQSKSSNKDFDWLKANMKNNAGLIENITIGSKINYDEYFKLAQLAVSTTPLNARDLVPGIVALNDPFSMDALTIEHVKLDKNGTFGLRPNDFLIVARIALRSDNPFVPNKILALISSSNYTKGIKCHLRSKLKLVDSGVVTMSDGLPEPNDSRPSSDAQILTASTSGLRNDRNSEGVLTLPVINRRSELFKPNNIMSL